jgi:hypothetical protein
MADLWTSKLSEYIDGTLSAADRQAVERHLVDCAECRVVLGDLRTVVAEASALTDTPPTSDLWQGIAGRISAGGDGIYHLPTVRGRHSRRISLTIPQLIAAGIALVILSGAVGRFLVSSPPGDAPTLPGPDIPVLQAAASGSQVAVGQALMDLQQILEAGRGELDSTTIQILEINLAIIDRAIDQAQHAIAADPANGYLQDHLATTMRQKLALMRQAADLVGTAS